MARPKPSYRIEIVRSAEREIAQLPATERVRVIAKIRGLASDPRPAGCVKLSGGDAWRVRQGDYRIVYEIRDACVTVTIVKVRHRRDVYR